MAFQFKTNRYGTSSDASKRCPYPSNKKCKIFYVFMCGGHMPTLSYNQSQTQCCIPRSHSYGLLSFLDFSEKLNIYQDTIFLSNSGSYNPKLLSFAKCKTVKCYSQQPIRLLLCMSASNWKKGMRIFRKCGFKTKDTYADLTVA